MEGRALTSPRSIVRGRLAALIACTLITTSILPISALAEYGIPAGSGAVITAGQPLAVRTAPGWDAAVSYEIADGSYVTVWDAAQAAPDGSMWYPVDGGFVPVDAVSSVAPAATETYNAPAPDTAADPTTLQGWIDPNTGEWIDPSASSNGWVDPTTGEWVAASAPAEGWVDPNTGQWVDASTVATETTTDGWIDPNTGEWVDASATGATGWVDPNTGQWVDASTAAQGDTTTQDLTSNGWVDPNTGQWVDASTATETATNGWIDPNTGEWVDASTAAPQQSVALYQEATDDQWVEPTDVATVDPSASQPVVQNDSASQNGWVEPTDAATGDQWVEPTTTDNQWVEPATDGTWVAPSPVDNGSSGGAESYGDPIGTAYISGSSGAGAACRASAQRGSEKLAVLAEGEPVEVRGEAMGEWQPVNCAGVGGYVNTSLISWEPAGTADTTWNESNVPADVSSKRGKRGGGGDSGSGQAMANFAMQYVGYPYVYAGEGPYAFDCSGFTKFVAQNTLGMDITHDLGTQIGMGQSVGKDQLQPGDLVFFQNTFQPGLSHVGIYIGGGQFVHAENESTGVRVSDLNSDYYGSRWAGGTRLA
jgi:cell wall-associated NlpC family hydrolase